MPDGNQIKQPGPLDRFRGWVQDKLTPEFVKTVNKALAPPPPAPGTSGQGVKQTPTGTFTKMPLQGK